MFPQVTPKSLWTPQMTPTWPSNHPQMTHKWPSDHAKWPSNDHRMTLIWPSNDPQITLNQHCFSLFFDILFFFKVRFCFNFVWYFYFRFWISIFDLDFQISDLICQFSDFLWDSFFTFIVENMQFSRLFMNGRTNEYPSN